MEWGEECGIRDAMGLIGSLCFSDIHNDYVGDPIISVF